MIDDLQRLNALVGQHFDERMVAQAEVGLNNSNF